MDSYLSVVKFQFELSLKRLVIKELAEGTKLTLNWIRGGKNIYTRVKPSVKDGPTVFNEKFMMKTSLEFDTKTEAFVPKPSRLQAIAILGADEKIVLGETDFDLANYSQDQEYVDKLTLRQEQDQTLVAITSGDHIEICIKSHRKSLAPVTPSTTKSSSKGPLIQQNLMMLSATPSHQSSTKVTGSEFLESTAKELEESTDTKNESVAKKKSDNLSALMVEFAEKEQQYKEQIAFLEEQVHIKQKMLEKKSRQLSISLERTKDEYAHLEFDQRQAVIRRDVQIQLLKQRIEKARKKQTKIKSGPVAAILEVLTPEQVQQVLQTMRTQQTIMKKEKQISNLENLFYQLNEEPSDQKMFVSDYMVSRVSSSVRPVESHHLGIGEQAVGFLIGNQDDISHHVNKVRQKSSKTIGLPPGK